MCPVITRGLWEEPLQAPGGDQEINTLGGSLVSEEFLGCYSSSSAIGSMGSSRGKSDIVLAGNSFIDTLILLKESVEAYAYLVNHCSEKKKHF